MKTESLQKTLVIQAFLTQFRNEHAALVQSAKAAHFAATHEESRAEDKHDTFAIEASYLAAGQATRVQELERTILEYENHLMGITRHSAVTFGSQIRYRLDGKIHHVFISLLGGGAKTHLLSTGGEIAIQALSLKSPLGDALEGCVEGETVLFELRGTEKKYEILSIA